jgi:outer membrane receptor for ferrienterochelin and colicins
MNHRFFIYSVILLFCFIQIKIFSQAPKTDANIVGHIVSKGQHLPFANISVKGTTIGIVSDQTGHYQLVNLPEGPVTLVVNLVGYKTQEISVNVEALKTKEIHFELEEDVLNLGEVVVSADRSEQKRIEAPVIVNTLSAKLFNTSHSVTLSDGLNYCPGLRLENNCQNCGFTQVRMNGLDGPYSQILINSRPIFSGLAGVYGLELIPTNMIEKVEVVRGGGSALYGSNAIAGTINIILKDPVANSYEIGANYSLTGFGMSGGDKTAPDYSLNFNTSLVSDDHKSGVTLYGFTRDRKIFDANGDGYSEISPMDNLTFGTRFFHRFGYRSKLAVDFFSIQEERNGGNKQDLPLHERDVAEAVKHKMKTAAITWEQYFRKYDMLSIFASGQFLDRESYYGANQSLRDYGKSTDRTYHIGAQYKANFTKSSVVLGVETIGSYLTDKKLAYPDYENAEIENDTIVEVPHVDNTIVSDQSSFTSGIFTQYEIRLHRTKIALGGRYDLYSIRDLAKEIKDAKAGGVFSPRFSLMFELFKNLQARFSYSQGYRAPQIFDEDLHIETSGSRQVINVNDPDLKQETSHSYMLSFDYNGLIGKTYLGLLIEGFYIRLNDPFVNEIGAPDEDGTVLYTRKNAEDGAMVTGFNSEFKLRPAGNFSMNAGLTVQSSQYDVEQEFNEKKYFRTPSTYGFFALDWDFAKDFCLSATGNYTGKMLVPYFGPNTDPETGELRISREFFDTGIKLKYTRKLNGSSIQWFGGIKNIFNSYQDDFDLGIDRDPSYMYGPVAPRTVYFGIKFGNFLD